MSNNFSHYARTLDLFFQDMKQYSTDTGFFRFAYQSRAHWMLTCIIGANNDNGIAFEPMCEQISRNLVSRSTIKNILDHGTKQRFFVKTASEIDKRIQLYRLSTDGIKAVSAWVDRQKDIFNNNN